MVKHNSDDKQKTEKLPKLIATKIETWKSCRHCAGKLERMNFGAFQTCRYTP